MSDFEELAQIIHSQHRLSRWSTWRECQMLLCYQARRIALGTYVEERAVQSEKESSNG